MPSVAEILQILLVARELEGTVRAYIGRMRALARSAGVTDEQLAAIDADYEARIARAEAAAGEGFDP